MKYRIAGDNEHPTRMTHRQFATITSNLSVGNSELLPKSENLKEYGRIVFALLGGETIIFAKDLEVPF